MRIAVLGGGVVGVTTAWYLAQDGHEVVLVEKGATVGEDASGGSAGIVTAGHAHAWASPEAPRTLARSLIGRDAAIKVKLPFDSELIPWGLRFLRECTRSRHVRNTLVKLRLAQYSQQLLNALRAEEQLDFGPVNEGVLFVCRTREELDAEAERMSLLTAHGQEQVTLDADQCVEHEPTLAPARDRIAGAVYAPTDYSGDCGRFTQVLAERCAQRGVELRLSTEARQLVADGDRVYAVLTGSGLVQADAFVLALGVGSPALARTIGVRLPIYPAKGYSATFPIRDHHTPPAHAGIDETTLAAWTSYGDRLRMSSTAQFSGYDRAWTPADFETILATARELLPNAADYSAGTFRACLRPMTPDGPPIIGRGGHRNLYYNTGHGHIGWTMACGSSRILADLVAQRTPALSTTGFDAARTA